MKNNIQSIRGVSDILPEQTPIWLWLESIIKQVTHSYGYQQIRLPIIEPLALFERAVGESTDIVSKEMYNFVDKSGEHITLRPEGTSSCARAVIEHNMCYNSTQRLWYQGYQCSAMKDLKKDVYANLLNLVLKHSVWQGQTLMLN